MEGVSARHALMEDETKKRKERLEALRRRAEEESRQAHRRLEQAAEEAAKAGKALLEDAEKSSMHFEPIGYWRGVPVFHDLSFADDETKH